MNEPESQRSPSGETWTFHSLREYLLRVVQDLSTAQSRLAEAQDKAVQAALVAQEKAVQAALAASDKAISKAEDQAERWRQSANEWRGAMNDRERAFVSRVEYDQGMSNINEKIARLDRQSQMTEGNKAGHTEVWVYLFGAIGSIVGIAGFIIAITR